MTRLPLPPPQRAGAQRRARVRSNNASIDRSDDRSEIAIGRDGASFISHASTLRLNRAVLFLGPLGEVGGVRLCSILPDEMPPIEERLTAMG